MWQLLAQDSCHRLDSFLHEKHNGIAKKDVSIEFCYNHNSKYESIVKQLWFVCSFGSRNNEHFFPFWNQGVAKMSFNTRKSEDVSACDVSNSVINEHRQVRRKRTA